MRYRKYYSYISFLDLLFNALLGFVFMFIIAFMAMNVKSRKADIESKAEFIISVTWDDNNPDDVDTWLQDPIGNILYFKQKDIDLAHLDRDDLGMINDKVVLAGGETIQNIYNQELTTIRGYLAGEWVLNLHMYNKRDPGPVTVVVRMDKLNPEARTVFNKKFILNHQGEEVTVTRFAMTEQGRIISWNDLPKALVTVVAEARRRPQ